MTPRFLPRVLLILGLGLAPLPIRSEGTPQPPPPAAEGHAHERLHRLADQLQLSQEQRATLRGLHEKHREELKARHQADSEARKAFRAAFHDPKASEADLRKLHQAASDRSLDLLLARRALRMEIREVLTPEQREKAAELHGRWEEKAKARREHIRALMENR